MDKAANKMDKAELIPRNIFFFVPDQKLEGGQVSFKPVIPVQILTGNNNSVWALALSMPISRFF